MAKKNTENKATTNNNATQDQFVDNTAALQFIYGKLSLECDRVFGAGCTQETIRQIAVETGLVEVKGRAGTLVTNAGLKFADISPEAFAKAQAEAKETRAKRAELERLQRRMAELQGDPSAMAVTGPTPVVSARS